MSNSDNKKEKISFSRRFSNLVWILKLALEKNPVVILYMPITVGFSVISAYINVNVTRWILDRVSAAQQISDVIYFIIGIFSFTLISNFINVFFEAVILPRKYIDLSTKIRHLVFEKVRHIDLINFQSPDFLDMYYLGLREIDSRAISLLSTIESILSGVLSFFLVTGVTATISGAFSVWGIIAGVYPFFINRIQQKIDYKMEKEKNPENRKTGYVARITTQPDYSADLKVYPRFIELLKYKSFAAVANLKKIICSHGKKTFLLKESIQIPEVLLKNILPWITIAILLFDGKITISEATVLASASKSIPSTLSKFVKGLGGLNPNSLYIENLRKLFEYPEYLESETDVKESLGEVNIISAENITFAYATDSGTVLKGITVNIEKGKKYALVGYNGAGKSTLARLLMRLYAPKDGDILINGKSISTYSVGSIREKIAYLGQDFKIYGFSVAENILMRPVESEADSELVNNAIAKVGLEKKISGLPDGINTNVTREFDKNGAYFSGGEMQKLALARLYAGNYDCIILDESTSALDPISEDEILNTVFDVFKDKTVIMISHRLVCIKYVDEVLFMSQGQITERGTHSEMIDMKGEYSKFYLTQAEKYYKS